MGTVYRAQQMVVDRPVALKVLHGHNTSDEREVARFRQEARAVATLCHPHTVTLIDYGETEDGVFFLVMELIVGRTLRELIESDAPMEVSRATHILAQIAESLAEAHASGIVHRDLKPTNVLLTEVVGQAEFVKVVDFGIAKVTGPAAASIRLTGTGLAIGSPRYMSPEQVSAVPVSAQSDFYALGAIFYEMVTGRPLFRHKEATTYLIAHLNEVPRWPEVDGSPLDGEAVEVFMACLSKLPSSRPKDAKEILNRLQVAAAAELLDRMSPVAQSRNTPHFSETTTVSVNVAQESASPGQRAPGTGISLTTTRRDGPARGDGSVLLPGQHVAVSASPTVFGHGSVASGDGDLSGLVTLLETSAPLGARHQLQTDFSVGDKSADEVSPGQPGGGARARSMRAIQLLGILVLVSASVMFLGDTGEVSEFHFQPRPERVNLSAVSPTAASSRLTEPSSVEPATQDLPIRSSVLVNSEPEGASVRVDGVEVGRAPVRLHLTLPMKTLSVELEGYHGITMDVRELHQEREVIVRLRARH